LILLIFSK